jgi:hypothetical protein
MSKNELEKKLKQINTKIDNLIIEGKSYKHLVAQHANIVRLLNSND